ncbi:MAG: ATP-binding cassette domain-containing protein, partial [Micromonosporaceae bacterium]
MTETAEQPGPGADPPQPSLLEVRDLAKRFGGVIALQGISTTVKAGEVTCVLGDNGAGKSTLIKVLSGVHRQDAGDYLLDGRPAQLSSPRDALDKGIATVYQDLAMI